MPGGGGEPSASSSSSGGQQHHHQLGERGGDRAAAAGLRYGGGDISLGHHGHPHHQLGGDDRQVDGSMDMLARHSSSPAGFFSNLVMDNGELLITLSL